MTKVKIGKETVKFLPLINTPLFTPKAFGAARGAHEFRATANRFNGFSGFRFTAPSDHGKETWLNSVRPSQSQSNQIQPPPPPPVKKSVKQR